MCEIVYLHEPNDTLTATTTTTTTATLTQKACRSKVIKSQSNGMAFLERKSSFCGKKKSAKKKRTRKNNPPDNEINFVFQIIWTHFSLFFSLGLFFYLFRVDLVHNFRQNRFWIWILYGATLHKPKQQTKWWRAIRKSESGKQE